MLTVLLAWWHATLSALEWTESDLDREVREARAVCRAAMSARGPSDASQRR